MKLTRNWSSSSRAERSASEAPSRKVNQAEDQPGRSPPHRRNRQGGRADAASLCNPFPLKVVAGSRLFLVDSNLVATVAIPVAYDRTMVGGAQLMVQVLLVERAVVVDVDVPLAVAIDAQFIDAVAVEIANHG